MPHRHFSFFLAWSGEEEDDVGDNDDDDEEEEEEEEVEEEDDDAVGDSESEFQITAVRMVLIRVIADQGISDFDSGDVDASMVRKAGPAEPTQAWSRLTEMVQHNFSASSI